MRTLLVVDSSPVVHRIVELTFSKEGMRVLAASDGDVALALIRVERPDAVLADQAAQGRNGYEVSAIVGADPGLSHIPVILLAGAFEPVDAARAAQCGCAGVLVKPLEPGQMVARVREAIRDAAASRAPGADGEGDELPTVERLLARTTAPAPPPAGRPEEPGERTDLEALAEALGARFDAGPDIPVPESPDQAATSASAALSATPAVPITEALVDELARRVLERLAPDAVRHVVTDVVVSVAERLVREEIARIRRERSSSVQ